MSDNVKRMSFAFLVLISVLTSCSDSDSGSGVSEKSPADQCYERCENNINTCISNANHNLENNRDLPGAIPVSVESMCTSLYNCDEECRYYQR